jgi:chromosome partitioning protein
MPILCMCGQKGGVGKSTIALSLAAEWHARGVRVLVVDADEEQRTALTWADVADEAKHEAPDVVSMGDNIRSALPSIAGGYDLTIIDCPGRNGRRATYALGLSDLAVLPCGPTGPQLWAMLGSLTQVRDVQALRSELDAAILVTQIQPGTVIGRRAREALVASEADVLATELYYRVTYGEAISGGRGPTTYAPRSEAAAEIRELVGELEQRIGLQKRKGKPRAKETHHSTARRAGSSKAAAAVRARP